MYTSSSIPNSYLGKCTYILVKFYRSVGQFGRPLALGARSRMFDSCHSDLQELSCNVHSLQGVVVPLETPPLGTCGGIGRHARFKILFERVWVQLPSGAFRLSNL